MYSALFREANAWSASRASMATGSNRPKAAPGVRQNSHSIGRRYLPERGQSTQCRLLSKHVVNGSGEINLFPLREWLNNQLDPPRAMHALRNDMDS